ncbi:hypothetical protein Krac_10393 [Ktedonobacter racemifer DSM 44963]|uniref:Uncharacterized protein n=1 Tax=Ktedonobacter racemifer DSM 44963 TaxID=485913 RepID=D6TGV8_KTERA|nr:hypothetical protein Krac_10393 [Ktedonobacter racemifer DSM 44963]
MLSQVNKLPLLLNSSKAVRKETVQVASRFGRPSPDPRFGSPIELRRGDAHRSLDLMSIGKTLASEGIASEEAPPPFLQIEPTGAFGNEDVLDARMVHQPGAGFQTIVTGEIVRDDKDVPCRIIRLDVFEQLNVVLGITRSRTARDLLAIADPQRSIDPHLVIPTTVFQGSFDAVPIR